jgi:hypothetical protein
MKPGDNGWLRMETFTTKAELGRRITEINKTESKMIFEE